MKNLEKEMEKFAELVIGKLRTLYPNLEFRYQDVRKNNGLILHGIILKDDKQIAPNIYLDDAFSEYKNGRSLDMIVSHISEIYEQSRKNEMVIDFTDYEKVKKLIRFKLVNTERNAGYLADIPHDEFLDLSKIYFLCLKDSEDGMATTVITNQFLEMWKKDKEEIALQAVENVKKEISFMNMKEILKEIAGISIMEQEDCPLYVLTNKARVYGAALMGCEDMLKYISHTMQKESFIILPSSIHEVLILFDENDSDTDFSALRALVADVNETQVALDEILSYSIYKYEIGKGISIAES